ncbi:hypothetical protein AJ79_08281 [Helicocarpus griseus UAMH5409]|uniref:Uncharacterized protein n=1 Tax=Helicocarpus griseus UAMH5409 TaxID=1447875 RepID=A0A2B7WTP5_9EURO|nr:hypothetical protein AJ79_08281 [Helicocarpus griseus UAMH5409]
MQFLQKNKSQPSLVGSVENRSHGNNSNNHSHQHQHHLQQQPSSTPHSPPQFAVELPGSNVDPQRHQHHSYVNNDGYDHHGYSHPVYTAHPSYTQQSQQLTDHHFVPGLAVTTPYPVVSESSQHYSTRPTLNLIPSAAPGFDSSDNSANLNVSSSDLSWTPQSPVASPQLESQTRKSRRSIFGFPSSSKDSTSTGTKVFGRNISVRRKTPAQASQTKKNPAGQSIEPTPESAEEHYTDDHMPLSKRAPQSHQQQQHPSYPSRNSNRSSSHIEIQSYDHRSDNHSVQRVHTDPLSSEESFYQQRQSGDSVQDQYTDIQQPAPRHPQFQINYPPRRDSVAVFTDQSSQPPPYSPQVEPHPAARPPSQQSVGPPPSPLHPQYQAPDQPQQKPAFRQTLQPTDGPSQNQGMPADRQTGLRQPMDNGSQHGQGREGMGSGQSQYQTNLPQGGSFKGNNHSQQSLGDQDRETPPPKQSREELSEADVRALMAKHEELQAKYLKVKKYYFEKDAQVQLLQNTVAHQRMSTSRTVLDDSEYATRFSRLDGAINNLAFNIRKDWKSIPVWLQSVINEDATVVGTKEMTAVGRACLTRWLVDEVFDRYFHPGLEPNLSRYLKTIERNVRRGAKVGSEEDRDNHLAKISAWRRTTLEGLGEMLQSRGAEENKAQITKTLTEKLTASLEIHLKTPPPPGLENGVSMIVELAIGISANIPFESREIAIEYFLPGSPISEAYMKLETTLPPLTTPVSESRSEPPSATDRMEQGSGKGISSEGSELDRENGKDSSSCPTTHSGQSKEPKKKLFGGLISKKPAPQGQHEMPRPGSALRDREGVEGEYGEGDGNNGNNNRVRFAAFVTVEVRSKGSNNVITKAPVYGFT